MPEINLNNPIKIHHKNLIPSNASTQSDYVDVQCQNPDSSQQPSSLFGPQNFEKNLKSDNIFSTKNPGKIIS